MKSIADIKHAFYINLENRPDRKIHVEKQMDIIGVSAERFNAVKMNNGAIGCSMSHLKLLETARTNDWDHILIVEDDILFTNPALFVQQMDKFLSRHPDFDVVLIGGNNMPPYTVIDDSCVKVKMCQTTTGYMVKRHYYDKLIDNFREGINKLLREPENHRFYAIDKYWFHLQAIDNWYLIVPLTVTQREDYSDIEKRPTNYTPAMLDLDKVAFLQRQSDIELLKKIKYMKMM
jgi:glycosyl transferase family 25